MLFYPQKVNHGKEEGQSSPKYQAWIDARERFHLSHAHIQMAQELGLNPRKFGGLAKHKQEPWKAPLPDFIASLYFERFKKERPDKVRSFEQMVKAVKRKKAERKTRKTQVVCQKSQVESEAE